MSTMTILVAGVALAVVAALTALRPTWTDRAPVALVWPLALLGALALGSSDAAPTGWVVLDTLVRVAAGAAVVLAASRLAAGWSAWLGLVTVVGLILADAGGWERVGAAGVGVAVAVVLTGGRQPVLQALAAAALIAPLGHLDWPVVTGASSALVVVGLAPLLLAGLRHAPDRLRSAVPLALALYVLVCFGGAVVGGLSAFSARADVDRAVDAAVAGLDGADADDPAPAIAKLREAATAFDEAETTLRAWWARPALLVPGVAQHARAVATMADSGAELATAAADSLAEVDLDALHPIDGQIDLDQLAVVEPVLDRTLVSLRSADRRLDDARSPLLIELVADRLDELASKVQDARSTAETASAALDVAPELLGAEGPRRYFLVMQTPSELRGVGGFMGSWGELVIDDGRFDLERTGRVRQLTEGGPDPSGRRIEGQPEFVGHWGQAPAQFWGLIGFSPDFPTVASIISQLYPQSGGGEVDGVISLDPASFAALLELTGPVAVEGYDGELGPENAKQVLLHDQYLGEDDADREAFLEAAIRRLFDELTAGELPGPRSISAALAPMVDGRHIQLFSTHAPEQRFFQSIDADGSVRPTRADGVGVVGQNYNGNKIDYFLRRALTYDVTWDPDTGIVEGTLEVRLENLAPASGLPKAVIGWGGDLSANQLPVADGENLTYVSLYSALALSEVTVDGQPAELNRVVTDLGYEATDLYVRIPSQGAKVIQARVRGQIEPGSSYRLELLRQSTATPDQLTAKVTVADGWRIERAGSGTTVEGPTVIRQGEASTPFTVDLTAEPVERSLLDRLQGR